MDLSILFRLLLAHIIADFALQPNCMSEGKKGFRKGPDGSRLPVSAGVKYGNQLLHSLTHAVVSYLFVAQWENWLVPVVIFSTHFVMDFIKSTYMKETTAAFLIDQTVHVSAILLLWWVLYSPMPEALEWLNRLLSDPSLYAVLVAYLLLLKPTSIFQSLFLKRWTPTEMKNAGSSGGETNSPHGEEPEKREADSLPYAGKWIGYLERILTLTFILANHIEGVGFLLAAKSIFRFGDLTKARDIKTTEYVLIGTLTSFTIAILLGFALLYYL